MPFGNKKGQTENQCMSDYCYVGLQVSGRRSRTTSESSTHSAGRERSNSAIKQVSPPPPSIPEQPPKEEPKKAKKDSPKKVHIHCLPGFSNRWSSVFTS